MLLTTDSNSVQVSWLSLNCRVRRGNMSSGGKVEPLWLCVPQLWKCLLYCYVIGSVCCDSSYTQLPERGEDMLFLPTVFIFYFVFIFLLFSLSSSPSRTSALFLRTFHRHHNNHHHRHHHHLKLSTFPSAPSESHPVPPFLLFLPLCHPDSFYFLPLISPYKFSLISGIFACWTCAFLFSHRNVHSKNPHVFICNIVAYFQSVTGNIK
jgi:hypothetical protein